MKWFYTLLILAIPISTDVAWGSRTQLEQARRSLVQALNDRNPQKVTQALENIQGSRLPETAFNARGGKLDLVGQGRGRPNFSLITHACGVCRKSSFNRNRRGKIVFRGIEGRHHIAQRLLDHGAPVSGYAVKKAIDRQDQIMLYKLFRHVEDGSDLPQMTGFLSKLARTGNHQVFKQPFLKKYLKAAPTRAQLDQVFDETMAGLATVGTGKPITAYDMDMMHPEAIGDASKAVQNLLDLGISPEKLQTPITVQINGISHTYATALDLAVSLKNPTLARSLIERGVPVDGAVMSLLKNRATRTASVFTPEDHALLEELLKRGANVRSDEILSYAVQAKVDPRTLQLLIDSGAPINLSAVLDDALKVGASVDNINFLLRSTPDAAEQLGRHPVIIRDLWHYGQKGVRIRKVSKQLRELRTNLVWSEVPLPNSIPEKQIAKIKKRIAGIRETIGQHLGPDATSIVSDLLGLKKKKSKTATSTGPGASASGADTLNPASAAGGLSE